MSLIGRIALLFSPQKPVIWPPPMLCGDGTYSFHVVGESHHQDEIEHINGGRSDDSAETEVTARLVPEPSNPYDAYAVRVEIHDRPVGHLSRGDAERYQRELSALRRNGQTLACAAMIKGGWDRGTRGRGHFGVFLDVIWPLRI